MGQGGVVNQVAGVLVQRGVQGDDVGAGVEVGERSKGQAQLGFQDFVGHHIKAQQPAAKAVQNAGNDAADAPAADDAHGFAVQIEPHKVVS